jgi:ribosome-associated translation inhibitor RaiA
MSEVAGGTPVAGIWDRIMGADEHELSADEARAVLRWKFPASDRQRVDELSVKARTGELTATEERELDEYLAIESALISLKSKARRALRPA